MKASPRCCQLQITSPALVTRKHLRIYELQDVKSGKDKNKVSAERCRVSVLLVLITVYSQDLERVLLSFSVDVTPPVSLSSPSVKNVCHMGLLQ